MNFRQISISGRSIAMAAALFGMVSLALGAHAALNKRSLATPEAFAVEQSAETASEPSRIALVIGNGHYPDANAPLTQPINDALVLTSATPGKVADDSAGQYSVLMAELLTNLRDQQADKPAGEANKPAGEADNSGGEATKRAGAETLFNKTRVAVAKSSEGEQVPSVSSSLVEEVRLGMSENSGG